MCKLLHFPVLLILHFYLYLNFRVTVHFVGLFGIILKLYRYYCVIMTGFITKLWRKRVVAVFAVTLRRFYIQGTSYQLYQSGAHTKMNNLLPNVNFLYLLFSACAYFDVTQIDFLRRFHEWDHVKWMALMFQCENHFLTEIYHSIGWNLWTKNVCRNLGKRTQNEKFCAGRPYRYHHAFITSDGDHSL